MQILRIRAWILTQAGPTMRGFCPLSWAIMLDEYYVIPLKLLRKPGEGSQAPTIACHESAASCLHAHRHDFRIRHKGIPPHTRKDIWPLSHQKAPPRATARPQRAVFTRHAALNLHQQKGGGGGMGGTPGGQRGWGIMLGQGYLGGGSIGVDESGGHVGWRWFSFSLLGIGMGAVYNGMGAPIRAVASWGGCFWPLPTP